MFPVTPAVSNDKLEREDAEEDAVEASEMEVNVVVTGFVTAEVTVSVLCASTLGGRESASKALNIMIGCMVATSRRDQLCSKA